MDWFGPLFVTVLFAGLCLLPVVSAATGAYKRSAIGSISKPILALGIAFQWALATGICLAFWLG